uniref:Uncharacterized protein n=1 Tax=Anopheles coluzzii TaxID=1518534 RepID=A0A8W7P144_ANOCL
MENFVPARHVSPPTLPVRRAFDVPRRAERWRQQHGLARPRPPASPAQYRQQNWPSHSGLCRQAASGEWAAVTVQPGLTDYRSEPPLLSFLMDWNYFDGVDCIRIRDMMDYRMEFIEPFV